ncbi:sterol desaturase family protein [Caulobacter sp. S45]|uniref:sterol desaturase family protein n=1 Tax=Caulobacter sp. S45 TaxID=1641861 RepID=UPI001576F4EE|nr:sterol desaturase family protein [Caulobacter sp. S45]
MSMLRGLQDIGLFLSALVGMEGVAWATHRFLMHGPLWILHRSHHEPRRGRFELNDLFALYFSLPSMGLILWGSLDSGPARWLGWGMAAYGLIYALFHDGLVHGRFHSPLPLRLIKRQVQAHRMHHAVATKRGCVSYGFLWAPTVTRLKRQLQANQARATAQLAEGTAAAPAPAGQTTLSSAHYANVTAPAYRTRPPTIADIARSANLP